MIRIKNVAIIAVFFFSILYCPAVSTAVVKVGGSAGSRESGESSRNTTGNTITRITSSVKTLNSSTLVLEDNRSFSLTGVDVINKKNSKRTDGKTVVEMLFVNNVLKQVVIH